ncbi:TPA: plasmid recombination protein, partial [Streptococcus agalactiae]|nr:plasmid recombination protein [Streptococcus agalactiae]
MVARMQKMKVGNLGGAHKHNERIFEKHSNKDIDTSRSHLNYELTGRDRSVSYERQIKDYVNENKSSKRGIRKDAVLCDEWIITSDKEFFEKLSQEQTRKFFETAKNYFAENYGETNVAYASVHLDESTPHMHLGIVPMRNGKLSSKVMFNREELKHIQEDLPKYMNEHGFELQRGKRDSKEQHLSVADYKEKMGREALNQELLDLGAP